jgi:hypothetical protein
MITPCRRFTLITIDDGVYVDVNPRRRDPERLRTTRDLFAAMWDRDGAAGPFESLTAAVAWIESAELKAVLGDYEYDDRDHPYDENDVDD